MAKQSQCLDGVSGNMGATGGTGTLFRSEIGKHVLSFHCLINTYHKNDKYFKTLSEHA